MRTEQITIYTVTELSEKAQQKAHEKYLNNGDYYFWSNENQSSLDAFCKFMPVIVKEYNYSTYGPNFCRWKFDGREEVKELCGQRLSTYIWNNYRGDIYKGKYYRHLKNKELVKHPNVKNVKYKDGTYGNAYYSKLFLIEDDCNLTGYSADAALLQPLFDFMRSPSDSVTFEDLINECLDGFLSECKNDVEYSESIEAFIEHAEANGYEYTEDGNRY